METTGNTVHLMAYEPKYAPSAHGVILVDFDGTLFPWGHLFNFNAQPMPGMASLVRRLHNQGFKIVIFTSRMSEQWLKEAGQTKKQHVDYITSLCNAFNIPFSEITAEKRPAQAYLDDRAIAYRDDAEKAWEDLKELLGDLE